MKTKRVNRKKLELSPENKTEEEDFHVLATNMVWEKGDIIEVGGKRYAVTSVTNAEGKTELELEAI
jgi:uncharacterized Zn finger protein